MRAIGKLIGGEAKRTHDLFKNVSLKLGQRPYPCQVPPVASLTTSGRVT